MSLETYEHTLVLQPDVDEEQQKTVFVFFPTALMKILRNRSLEEKAYNY